MKKRLMLIAVLLLYRGARGEQISYTPTYVPLLLVQAEPSSSWFNWRDYLPSTQKACAWIQKTSVAVLKGMLFTISADLVAQGHPEAAVAFASILEFYTPQELICAATVYEAGGYIQNVAEMVGDTLPRIPHLSQAAKIAIKKALSKAVNTTLEAVPD